MTDRLSQGLNGDMPTSGADEIDEQLKQLLTERYGEGFTPDNLEQWHKEKKGWLSKENSQNQERIQAIRDAEEAKERLLLELSARDRGLATGDSADSKAGEMSEDQFFHTLGLQNGEDVLTGRQAFALWQGASNWMNAANKVYGEHFSKLNEDIQVTKKEFNELQADMAQQLTSSYAEQLIEKYPNADPVVIERAIEEAPQGDQFDLFVETAAQESHDHVSGLAVKAGGNVARRRNVARRIRTGVGPGGAPTGAKPRSVLTSGGITDFMDRHPVGED